MFELLMLVGVIALVVIMAGSLKAGAACATDGAVEGASNSLLAAGCLLTLAVFVIASLVIVGGME